MLLSLIEERIHAISSWGTCSERMAMLRLRKMWKREGFET